MMDTIIVLTVDDQKFNFTICFDEYGNLYLDGSNYINNEYFDIVHSLIFQLNVDRDNNPYFDPGNYEIISDIIINKLPLDKQEEDKKEHDENEQDNHEFIIELDSDGNEILCDDDPKFTFYGNLDIKITDRENGDVAALYDTEIYHNTVCIMSTASGDNSSIYKLKLNLNGDVYFGCMCDKENKYTISINKLGELLFISV